MKAKLSALMITALAIVFSLAVVACDKDASKDPPQPPGSGAVVTDAATTSPPAANEPKFDDAGRRDISDGGFYPGKSTKPM